MIRIHWQAFYVGSDTKFPSYLESEQSAYLNLHENFVLRIRKPGIPKVFPDGGIVKLPLPLTQEPSPLSDVNALSSPQLVVVLNKKPPSGRGAGHVRGQSAPGPHV